MHKGMIPMTNQHYQLEQISDDWTTSKRLQCTPSDMARNALLYVQEIGTLTNKQSHVYSRTHLDSYLFAIVLEGKGVFHYRGHDYPAVKGDVVFLDCRYEYSHCSSDDAHWKLAWIHWNGMAMQHLYPLYAQRHNSIILTGISEICATLYEEIKDIILEDSPDSELYASQNLFHLTTHLITSTRPCMKKSEHTAKKWPQIREYLEENFSKKITLEDLAEHFDVSKYYMLHEFKKQYNITIIQYLNQCRINHAKKLLRFTDMQIEQIADTCGIRDSSYFNRIFHSSEGITASAFRKQWRN